MRVLGIETSCDETAVSLIEASGEFGNFQFRVLGNALISQVKEHAQYGGVFPNVAKREHARNLVPVLSETLRQANTLVENTKPVAQDTHALETILERENELLSFTTTFLENFKKPDIDCIAVTVGPGLEPALWVGINFAKALAHAWNVPIVPVNHMEGHIVMASVHKHGLANLEFPLLSLLISGGHTELVLSREWMRYELVGQTRDDAAGEAFDKVARLLELPYPGGPEISRLAAVARKKSGMTNEKLPRPMLHSKDYDFSFSGLKTAVRNLAEAHKPFTDEFRKSVSLEFENAVTDVLVSKTLRAVEEFGARTLVVGGGVSANTFIRESLRQALEENGSSAQLLFPTPELATDNALMIALAGYFHAAKKEYAAPENLVANGNLKLT